MAKGCKKKQERISLVKDELTSFNELISSLKLPEINLNAIPMPDPDVNKLFSSKEEVTN